MRVICVWASWSLEIQMAWAIASTAGSVSFQNPRQVPINCKASRSLTRPGNRNRYRSRFCPCMRNANIFNRRSKAMGGRRTPRQVASRVQKYFEKLKPFGIGAVV
ncbi:hypothetical protein EDB86DRAFT_1365193 [Lactarius hatsudake]|nr:hypothetical protein EDB86DRAFT_1365193 [Lactarius hatsudake]